MQMILYTEEFFNAAHQLIGYNGKCSSIHGHSWKVGVWVKGEEKQKDNVGILWDFNNLKQITDGLDHKSLNEIINENPSVENLSKYIYTRLKENHIELHFKVRVYESVTKKESYCEIGDF